MYNNDERLKKQNNNSYPQESHGRDSEKGDIFPEYEELVAWENDWKDENGHSEPHRTSLLLRLAALVTALAFLGLVLTAAWPVIEIPLADLLAKSFHLKKDINIKRLQEAVVKIEIVSRRQGSIIAERKSGTGFNIRPEGLIVTNYHVINGAINMMITFPGGEVYRAESWAARPEFDLAVVKLKSQDTLPVVPVSPEGMPGLGERVRVVGNPLGLNNIAVEGKVNQYLRVKDKGNEVFSIEAPIYPGNSGSPVFNDKGEAVGVVFARYQEQINGEEKVFGLVVPIAEVLNMGVKP